MASVDSFTIIDAAQETGTQAVIKSPHFERLTPLVSRRGRIRITSPYCTNKSNKKKNNNKSKDKSNSVLVDE